MTCVQRKNGKTEQILCFIQQFIAEHGYGPTVREIGDAVGLRSTSTVHGYIERMQRNGLVTQVPLTPRSLRVVTNQPLSTSDIQGNSVLNCSFIFPVGTTPVRVFAMVSDNKYKRLIQVAAETVEIVQTGAAMQSEKNA